MTYPKLPIGPSPDGTAGARALTEGGFTNKRTADYVAKSMGQSFRVTPTGGDMYLTQGDLGLGSQVMATTNYAAKFHSTLVTTGTNCDFGLNAYYSLGSFYQGQQTYTYPSYTTGTDTVKFTTSSAGVEYVGVGFAQTTASVQYTFQATWTNMSGSATNTTYYVNVAITGISMDYVGRVDLGAGNGNEAMLFGVSTQYNGRSDSVGRQLYDPTYTLTYSKSNPTQYALPLYGRSDSDYEWPSICGVSSSKIYVLLAERFTLTGTPTVAVQPHLWLYASSDGAQTWQIVDVTATVFADVYLPTGTNFAISSGFKYNAGLMYMYITRKWIMCANDTALMSFVYYDHLGSLASKLIRVQNTSVTVLTTFSSLVPTFIESMVYVGNNTVVAKKVAGILGTGFAVTFMKSTDNGASWAEYTPSGLSAPLQNQYLGELFLDRAEQNPYDQNTPPRILMVGWDSANAQYRVHYSMDYGQTWKASGVVGKPSSFQRIDTMLGGGDGGGNFNTLSPAMALSQKRTVDLALPTRYVRTTA